MKNLLNNEELENSCVVANCTMNRERNLLGSNGYDHDLKINPLDFLSKIRKCDPQRELIWLDLCCGSGKALIQAAEEIANEQTPIRIVGIDLVDMFQHMHSQVEFTIASLSNWQPDFKADLITCVHGLHYIGDKVDLMLRAVSWLNSDGLFIGNLDRNSLKVHESSSGPNEVLKALKEIGFEYNARQHLIRWTDGGPVDGKIAFEYVGADDNAGPNYTGQPAVDSYYRRANN